ncbi:MAG: hypothetical protein AMXMBFR16_11500 [Candidatus Uhrbacteria bacterium]
MLTEKQVERFWRKVEIRGPNDCWGWKGWIANGYGRFYANGWKRAHRVAYVLTYGPTNLSVLHKPVICHNPACCNPKHLYAGTTSDNARDRTIDGTVNSNNFYRASRRVIRNDGVLFNSIREAARISGCSEVCVGRHCNGLRKTPRFQYFQD